jgi:hypothetical protein
LEVFHASLGYVYDLDKDCLGCNQAYLVIPDMILGIDLGLQSLNLLDIDPVLQLQILLDIDPDLLHQILQGTGLVHQLQILLDTDLDLLHQNLLDIDPDHLHQILQDIGLIHQPLSLLGIDPDHLHQILQDIDQIHQPLSLLGIDPDLQHLNLQALDTGFVLLQNLMKSRRRQRNMSFVISNCNHDQMWQDQIDQRQLGSRGFFQTGKLQRHPEFP